MALASSSDGAGAARSRPRPGRRSGRSACPTSAATASRAVAGSTVVCPWVRAQVTDCSMRSTPLSGWARLGRKRSARSMRSSRAAGTVTPRWRARLVPDRDEHAADGGRVHRFHGNDREPAGERSQGLDRLPVLLRRRRPDHRDVAARERRLEPFRDVVNGGQRERVHLVEEQHDRRMARLGQHVLDDARRRLGRRGEPQQRQVEHPDVPSAHRAPCPSAIRVASPSTIAVLPDPAGPISAGLRLVFRSRTPITASSSPPRPTIGPSRPARARATRSRPSRSSVGVDDARSDQATVTRGRPSRRPSSVRRRSRPRSPPTTGRPPCRGTAGSRCAPRRTRAGRRWRRQTVTPLLAARRSRIASSTGRVAARSSLDRDRREQGVEARGLAGLAERVGIGRPDDPELPRVSGPRRASSAPTPPSVRPTRASWSMPSMNRMTDGCDASRTSWAIRSSSWPRYCVPAMSAVIGTSTTRAPQRPGHRAGDDPARDPFDDGRLADALGTEQHGARPGRPAQGLDQPRGLGVAPDRRRQQAFARERRQVAPDLVEQRRPGAAAGSVGRAGRGSGWARRRGGPGRRGRRRGCVGRGDGRQPRRGVLGAGRESAPSLGPARGEIGDPPAEPGDREIQRGRRSTVVRRRHRTRSRSLRRPARPRRSATPRPASTSGRTAAGRAAPRLAELQRRRREAVGEEPPVGEQPLGVVGEDRVGGLAHLGVEQVELLEQDWWGVLPPATPRPSA